MVGSFVSVLDPGEEPGEGQAFAAPQSDSDFLGARAVDDEGLLGVSEWRE
ncbi:hypothetical protein [Ornithinimicrobium faecis]|nr:hypothetical protein [Ornithinimicrobium sp. HY1745]